MRKKSYKKSRRGDVAITLFVIGIFALCGFALLTFFISDFNLSHSFIVVGATSNITSNMDEYLFYKNVGMPGGILNSFFKIESQYGKQYLYDNKSVSKGIPFISSHEVQLFSIKYQIPSSPFPPQS